MYNYTEEDRNEVQRRISDPTYRQQAVDMGFAYELYDILRILLEAVHDTYNKVDQIEKKTPTSNLTKGDG